MTTALHALAHAWDDVANFGPWYVFWTLPLERYMKFMRANIFSGTYPAANFITRAKRIQRLAYLSPRIRRSLRKQFAATGYQPSEALAGALGQRRRKIGWLGVRDFSEIKSFGTFDLALFQSVHMKDHPVFAPFLSRANAYATAVVNAEDYMENGVENARYRRERKAEFASQYLLEHVAITCGRSLRHKRRYYGSAYAEGPATPETACASWVWVFGEFINERYSGMWHGRILYFVKVATGTTILSFEAIRIFDASRIRSERSYSLVTVIGGREALCSRENDHRRWIVYIDYDPDEL